jgi:hypothetical protein
MRHQHESNNKANYLRQAHYLYPSPRVSGEVILDYEWRGCEREVEFVVLYSTEWTGINTQAVAVLLYGVLMHRKVAVERDRVHC